MSIIEYIEEAIQNGKSIIIKYEKYGGELSTRKLSDIHYSDEFGEEYIEGFCHLRNERRTFKISRIREVDGIKAITYTGAIGKNKSAYNPNLSNSISRPATTAELNEVFESQGLICQTVDPNSIIQLQHLRIIAVVKETLIHHHIKQINQKDAILPRWFMVIITIPK